jgi:pSer/pThr/pTyr-binding forkhead associated (FHA) protein
MQFRLRYLAHDFELPPGEFVIGRSDECQLAVDDPLVSRRHAVLRVTPVSVIVVDLGSRNGVLVNGEKITHERRLRNGDKVAIGSQEMVLTEITSEEVVSTGRALSQTLGDISLVEVQRALATRAEVLRVPPSEPEAPRGRDSAPTFTNEPTLAGPAPLPPSAPKSAKLETTFKLLTGVADKALAMGRAEEAERILAPLLGELLGELRRSQGPDQGTVDRAVAYALKIASGTAKGAWVDYVFEVYLATGKLFPAPLVDELHVVVRKVKSPNLRVVREYVEAMRAALPRFSATERFLFQRVEGLEQLCALK